jgi:glyoxylase-like metal-dependent hydrolase (beta-lactamase superfamily II)
MFLKGRRNKMKVVKPTVFPKPGTYSTNKVHVNIMSFTNDAQIYYTLDGSEPNENSAVFNINNGLLTLKLDDPDADGKLHSQKRDFIIKAKAVKEGYQDSESATFHYSLSTLPEGEFFYTILQEKVEGSPAVIRIEDQYQVKMYFIIGSERALLIDGGYDRETDLKSLLDTFVEDLPYDGLVTHAHPDHDAQAQSLINQGITVYYNSEDLPTYEKFGGSLEGYTDYKEGQIFDLGDCRLKAYKIPGHTVGHMVLFDEKNGLLFASDAFGNNRNTLLDTAFLQFGDEESTMNEYLSVLQNFRYATKGKIKKVFFGHNDNVLGESYLENLEKAVQQVVDLGEEALSPTLRPEAECYGSGKISLVGNYISEIDWIGVNIIKPFSGNYTAENISTLSGIFVENGTLEPKFQPNIENYTLLLNSDVEEIDLEVVSTSTNVKRIRLHDQDVKSKEVNTIKIEDDMIVSIHVVAPNGIDKKDYQLVIKK